MEDTLRLLSIIRLLQPHVLLPSTTALGTIHPLGREKGIQAGANVVMPNLSPVAVRENINYMIIKSVREMRRQSAGTVWRAAWKVSDTKWS